MANTSLERSKLKEVAVYRFQNRSLNGRHEVPDITTAARRRISLVKFASQTLKLFRISWAWLAIHFLGWMRIRNEINTVALDVWYEKPHWAVELWEKDFNLDFNCDRRMRLKQIKGAGQ